jgi:hypothetical protein
MGAGGFDIIYGVKNDHILFQEKPGEGIPSVTYDGLLAKEDDVLMDKITEAGFGTSELGDFTGISVSLDNGDYGPHELDPDLMRAKWSKAVQDGLIAPLEGFAPSFRASRFWD